MKSPIHQFIAVIKELRDALLDIPTKLSLLDQDIQEQTKVVRDSNKAHSAQSQPSPNIPIEVKVPQGVEVRTEESEKQSEKTYQGWSLFLQGATLVAVSIYALVAIFRWCEMRRAAKAAAGANRIAAQTLRENERAWAAPHITNQIFGKNLPLEIIVKFANTGRTPAIHVQTCVVSEIVEKTRPNIDISCPDSIKSPGLGIIFPNDSIERMTNAVGQGGKANIDPQGLLREGLMKELRHWDKNVWVYGRIDYWDIYQRPHWATFCSTMIIMPPAPGGLPETKNWMACQNGNAVDPQLPEP